MGRPKVVGYFFGQNRVEFREKLVENPAFNKRAFFEAKTSKYSYMFPFFVLSDAPVSGGGSRKV